ncbi:MAG: hypothetical protein HQL31_04045 [Planctomycetes bacterium]|nr:hypothetical protein [Planctomycetota bacterium]
MIEGKKIVIVDHRRLTTDTFEAYGSEGDIAKTYSGDTLSSCSKVRRLRGVFTHEGVEMVCVALSSSYATCYTIVPEAEYDGPDEGVLPYSYSGMRANFKSRKVVLVQEVCAIAGKKTQKDLLTEIRAMFKNGGHFARVHDGEVNPYRSFLESSLADLKEFVPQSDLDPVRQIAQHNCSNSISVIETELLRFNDTPEVTDMRINVHLMLNKLGYQFRQVNAYLEKLKDQSMLEMASQRLKGVIANNLSA